MVIVITNIRYKIGNNPTRLAELNVQRTIAEDLKSYIEKRYKKTNTKVDFMIV